MAQAEEEYIEEVENLTIKDIKRINKQLKRHKTVHAVALPLAGNKSARLAHGRPETFRHHLRDLLEKRVAHYIVWGLLAVDIVLVIVELLLEIQECDAETKGEESKKERLGHAIHAIHFVSIAILAVFVIEVGLKIIALGRKFFHHKLEVLDAIVVIIAFILDLAISNDQLAAEVAVLVIIRLWRFTRIINAVVISSQIASHEKSLEYKRAIVLLEHKCGLLASAAGSEADSAFQQYHKDVQKFEADLNREDSGSVIGGPDHHGNGNSLATQIHEV